MTLAPAPAVDSGPTSQEPALPPQRRRLLGPQRIPWGTVLALSALMSAADAFVLMAARGAVGAIERTGGPFLDWLRTSALTLPLFVLAVLVALAVARRHAGPVLHAPRAVLVTAGLIVVAGTFVGTAVVAVSAAYDYHLQSAQLQSTAALHGSAHALHGQSVSVAQAASLRADELGARNAGRLVLVANLVIVGWVTAMRGGRLEATNVRGRPVP